MGKIYLSTKNNLLKLQNSIKEYKNGQMLIEEKELILKNKLESYKDEAKNTQNKLNEILESLYLYKVEEKNEVNPKICEILWMLFRTYPFNELIFEISYDRLIVGLLESGYVDDIKYTDEAVANFLGKDKVDVYILNLEFKRRVYTNNLLSDIIENRDKYLKQVKEDKTKTI